MPLAIVEILFGQQFLTNKNFKVKIAFKQKWTNYSL